MLKNKIAPRLIMTYLSVVLPLLLVSFLLTGTLLRGVEQEEMDKIKNELNQLAAAFEYDFESYASKSISLIQTPMFSSGKLVSDPLDQLDGIEQLKKLCLFDDRANEIQVYYGEGFLFGDDGIVSPDVYFRTTLGLNEANANKAISVLSSEDSHAVILQTVSGRPYLFYHIPVGKDPQGRMRSVEYTFSIKVVEELAEANLGPSSLLLEISLGDNSIYLNAETGGCTYISNSSAENVMEDYSAVPMETTILKGYGVIRIWYGELQETQNIQQLQRTSTLILVIGVFLSTAISLGLGVNRIRSVRRLSGHILDRTGSRESNKKWIKNEFDYIQALIDESIRDGDVVRKEVRNYRTIIMQQVAMMIFHGVLRDKKKIHSILSICGTELAEKYYFVCGIQLESELDADKLEEYLCGDLHYREDDYFVITICEINHPDYDMQERMNIANRLISTLRNTDISCMSVFMSQVYQHISMANYAYLEVRTLLNYKESVSDVICWEEMLLQNNHNDFRLDNDHLQTFYVAVEEKDRHTAERMLDRIFHPNILSDAGEDTIRYLRHMVLQALRLGDRSLKHESSTIWAENMNGIEQKDNDTFIQSIKEILKDYCSDNQYDWVLDYVHENFMRFNLSLDELAAIAKISKSQMSKVFRAETGIGYLEYVTNLRMEESKKLLTETDINVKQIFSMVGYVDGANASKKFKSMFGMTPSEYRSLTRGTDDSAIDIDRSNIE